MKHTLVIGPNGNRVWVGKDGKAHDPDQQRYLDKPESKKTAKKAKTAKE